MGKKETEDAPNARITSGIESKTECADGEGDAPFWCPLVGAWVPLTAGILADCFYAVGRFECFVAEEFYERDRLRECRL